MLTLQRKLHAVPCFCYCPDNAAAAAIYKKFQFAIQNMPNDHLKLTLGGGNFGKPGGNPGGKEVAVGSAKDGGGIVIGGRETGSVGKVGGGTVIAFGIAWLEAGGMWGVVSTGTGSRSSSGGVGKSALGLDVVITGAYSAGGGWGLEWYDGESYDCLAEVSGVWLACVGNGWVWTTGSTCTGSLLGSSTGTGWRGDADGWGSVTMEGGSSVTSGWLESVVTGSSVAGGGASASEGGVVDKGWMPEREVAGFASLFLDNKSKLKQNIDQSTL